MYVIYLILGLKDKLKSQEIQNQRLREVFKKSSQEFRESIYTLLGYKVDGLQNNMYRLTSQFAFHEEDNLMFQVFIYRLMNKINIILLYMYLF